MALNFSAIAKMQSKSYDLQIKGISMASTSAVNTAKTNVLRLQEEATYNIGKLMDETMYKSKVAAREFASLSSAQRAAAGASGFLVTSGSFLDVYAEAMDVYSRDVNKMRIETDKDIARIKLTTQQKQQDTMLEAKRQAEAYKVEMQGIRAQQEAEYLSGFFQQQAPSSGGGVYTKR